MQHEDRQRHRLLDTEAAVDALREIASGRSIEALEAERRSLAQALLERGAALARAPRTEVRTEVRFAVEALADTIVEAAEDNGCGLIVLGKGRHGTLQKALLGSTAAAVVQRSRLPVLLVPAHQPHAT